MESQCLRKVILSLQDVTELISERVVWAVQLLFMRDNLDFFIEAETFKDDLLH